MGARPSSYAPDAGAVEEAPEPRPVASRSLPWRTQQTAVFDWFGQGTGHLVIRARAGTGKTTTLIAALAFAPEDDLLVTAYNTRITEELFERTKDDSRVTACSLHAIGKRSIQASTAWRRAIVSSDGTRGRDLTDAVCPKTVVDSAKRVITRLHTKAREMMPHATGARELFELAILDDHTHPQFPTMTLCEWAYEAMLEAAKPAQHFDFADMIYLPIRCGLVRPYFGLIVVDEAQDMSAPQLEIAQMSLAPGGRMVVVGDDRQAIYRFRGADSNALDRLKTELHASELGLTTTFRCGARIVQEAQRLVPDIQALPTIHEGAYDVVSAGRLYATVRPGDFVLSRLNAPLTRCAMTLLRRGTRAKIQGRDIGRTLSALADRISQWGKITNMALWRNELDAWCAREVRKAEEADVLARAALVTDQAATLLVLAENATDVAGIKDRISYLFDDVAGDNSFVICSTVHRAKGLEADSVYVLADTFVVDVQCLCGHRHRRGMPECLKCKCGAYVPDPGAVLEEQNIRYVAITRAKRNLWWVISEVR